MWGWACDPRGRSSTSSATKRSAAAIPASRLLCARGFQVLRSQGISAGSNAQG